MPYEQLQPRAVASAGGGDFAEAGEVVMVRRSAIALRLTCGLCGGILRGATTVSECLHSFCRKCIFKKFEDEDITCCPTCSTDLGCHPLEKLRADRSLTCIRLMVFPVKRRKIEGISLLHPALVSQPYHLPRVHEVGQSAKKSDAFFAGESINGEAETEAAGSFGMEPTASPTKTSMHSISAPAEEIGTFIVTIEKENRARAAAESTLSPVVDSTAEGRAALPLVTSQSEIHEVEVEVSKYRVKVAQVSKGKGKNKYGKPRTSKDRNPTSKLHPVTGQGIVKECPGHSHRVPDPMGTRDGATGRGTEVENPPERDGEPDRPRTPNGDGESESGFEGIVPESGDYGPDDVLGKLSKILDDHQSMMMEAIVKVNKEIEKAKNFRSQALKDLEDLVAAHSRFSR